MREPSRSELRESREGDGLRALVRFGGAPKRSRAGARAARGRIAESLREVTERRRSAMREPSRSELRESREGDV